MNNKEIGKFIKELRIKAGLSQKELADMIYVSREAVSKWETGKNMPTYDIILILADLFKVSVDEILLGEKKNSKTNKTEIIKSIYDDKIRLTKRLQRRTKILITSIIFFALSFFIYYFLNSYDSVKVYLVRSSDSEIILNNGILVLTSEKIYFRLGNIIYTDKDKITGVEVYYDCNSDSRLLYSTDMIDDVLVIDYLGSGEYFEVENKNLKLNNLYMKLTLGDIEKTVKLSLENDYSNNHLFFKKSQRNFGKEVITKETSYENREFMERLKTKFERNEDNIYSYVIKDKGIEYNYIFYEGDLSRLNIEFKENNLSYMYKLMLDDSTAVYYVFDGNGQIDGDIFNFDLEKEPTTEQESKLINLIKKIDK